MDLLSIAHVHVAATGTLKLFEEGFVYESHFNYSCERHLVDWLLEQAFGPLLYACSEVK